MKATEIDLEFDQSPEEIDHIKCPNCMTIQSARIKLSMPRIYVHDCIECGYTITKNDWESIL